MCFGVINIIFYTILKRFMTLGCFITYKAGAPAALKTWRRHIYTVQEPRIALHPHQVIFSREGPKTWQGQFPMSPYVWAPLQKIKTIINFY